MPAQSAQTGWSPRGADLPGSMRSVPQPGQVPWVRMAIVKQVPQILPSGQLARCLPAAREHLSQVNAPVVRGRPRTASRELMSAVIADYPGSFGPDGLVQVHDVGVGGDLADLGICRCNGD
jgi:hypothetical protein